MDKPLALSISNLTGRKSIQKSAFLVYTRLRFAVDHKLNPGSKETVLHLLFRHEICTLHIDLTNVFGLFVL